jgi:hypothetical protein
MASTARKLPFADTIWEGYRMAFTRFPDLVRAAWLPWVAALGIPFLLFRFWEAELGRPPVPQGGWMWASAGVALIANVAGTLSALGATLRVLILDEKSRDVIAQWRFGRDELRLFGAHLIVLAIMLAVMAAMAAALTLSLAQGAKQIETSWIFVPLFIAAWLGLYYFIVRSLLFFPHVIAEKRIDFSGAWRLTRGNFWRLFGVILVGGILLSIVLGPVFGSIIASGITVESPKSLHVDLNRLLLGFLAIGFLMNSVQFSLIAAAYNYLSGRDTGGPEAEPS